MVNYAYDISPKQSARVIGHSVKLKSTIWVEPIEPTQFKKGLSTQIVSSDNTTITLLILRPDTEITFKSGEYYHLIFSLGEERYLGVSDFQLSKEEGDKKYLIFTRPKTLQVMQRRKYRRVKPAVSIPVYISWEQNEQSTAHKTPAFGQVIEISTHGMSMKTSQTIDNYVFIGDTIYIRFNLSVHEPTYFTPATICHKRLNKEKSELILGLQFILSEENTDFLKRLSNALSKYSDVSSRGG